LRIYSHDSRRRITRIVDVSDGQFEDLYSIIDYMELPVKELVGATPRIPVRLDHLL